jgi:5-methylcytosine-specific restriction endonuclease McrA
MGDLTLDHVVPRSRGGRTSWDNVVCCCRRCNAKKGNRLLGEMEMGLINPVRKPRYYPFQWMNPRVTGLPHLQWEKYLDPFSMG